MNIPKAPEAPRSHLKYSNEERHWWNQRVDEDVVFPATKMLADLTEALEETHGTERRRMKYAIKRLGTVIEAAKGAKL